MTASPAPPARPAPPEPPELPRRLLVKVLPPDADGLTILGDLLEEFRDRAAADGVRAARGWYRRQALVLTVQIVLNPDRPRRVIAQTFSDFRLACRSVARAPVLMTAIVVTIGLAVAANTALFSVFDGLLFRPLPYRSADRIVRVDVDPMARASLSPDSLDRAVERAGTTPSLTERAIARPATLLDRAGAAVTDWGLRTYQLSPSSFDLLGVQPTLGRAFTEEDRSATPIAVLLGHDVWRTRFAGDATILDRLVTIPGTAQDERWRVVGVMPPGFSFPEGANFWVPDLRNWPPPLVMPYARLAPGVTLEALRAELPHFTITPLREHVRPSGAYSLALLLSGTTLMLLVAWVQVAALLFARATGRTAEIGVRLALGATRARLARQFGLEAAVVILLALGLAAVIAPALTAWIVDVLPADTTLGQHVDLDVRAFVFAAGLSVVGLLVLTLLPVDLIRRCSPARLVRGAIAGDMGPRTTRVRTALFVGQLAIATAVLYLTGLAAQSLVNVADAPLGFATADLYAIRMPRGDSLFGTGRARFDRQRQAVAETIDALRRLPGVQGVAGTNSWPLQPDGLGDITLVPDADPGGSPITGRRGSIQPGYPAVLGVPLLDGTEPTLAELSGTGERNMWLTLANQSLARQVAPFGPVVGQVMSGRYRIIGVMPDVVLDRPDRPVAPTLFLYLPPIASVNVVLFRLEAGHTPEQAGIPAALQAIWHSPAPRPFPVADAVHLAASHYRARTFLLGLVAILTVPLTMLGVAGALAYATKQRAREIAIELAIGADARDIRRRIVRQALRAATVAVAMGLALGIAIGRVTSSALFGVRAADPLAVVVSIGLVLIVAWAAAFIPGYRAGRFSPALVLRES